MFQTYLVVLFLMLFRKGDPSIVFFLIKREMLFLFLNNFSNNIYILKNKDPNCSKYRYNEDTL